MDIFKFCEQFSTTEHTIAYMRNRGLLRQIPPICGRNSCPRRMTQVKNQSFPTDGLQWRCSTHKGNKMSIIPLHTQKQMIRLANQALVDWSQFFRDICSRWLLDHPIRYIDRLVCVPRVLEITILGWVG